MEPRENHLKTNRDAVTVETISGGFIFVQLGPQKDWGLVCPPKWTEYYQFTNQAFQ